MGGRMIFCWHTCYSQITRMTNQPPLSLQDIVPEPISLASTINKLHSLIFGITLPKTKAAKTATNLHWHAALHAWPSYSTCTSFQDIEGLQLNKINKQLDSIANHLGISDTTQPASRLSYAALLPPSQPKLSHPQHHPPVCTLLVPLNSMASHWPKKSGTTWSSLT